MANAILNFHFDYLTTSLKEIINITNKDIMSFVELIPDIPKASKGHDKHLRTIYDQEQLYMYG